MVLKLKLFPVHNVLEKMCFGFLSHSLSITFSGKFTRYLLKNAPPQKKQGEKGGNAKSVLSPNFILEKPFGEKHEGRIYTFFFVKYLSNKQTTS